MCSAATCHLHFWQNDQDLLRATAMKRYGGADTEIIGSNSFVCGLPNPLAMTQNLQNVEGCMC